VALAGLRLSRLFELGRALLETLLRPYSQIVFSRNLVAGGLVLAAVTSAPRLAAVTLAAVALAAVVTWLLGLGGTAVREGGFGCMALLTVLALVAFAPSGGSLTALVLIGVPVAVLLAASFQTLFARLALPAYILPFVAAAWLVHLAARSLPARETGWSLLTPFWFIPPELSQASWLDVPASLLFLHGMVPGALLLLAVLVHSRIACLLAGVGAATASAMHTWLRPELTWSALDTMAAFNAVLTAMAIGGVWFVPQPSSIALAAASAGVSVLVTYALVPALGLLSLPVLSLPFMLTVLAVLTAARMREGDRRPRATLPAERPEDALAQHLLRVRRFGELAWIPFRLPFRGEWFVSQGFDGAHTHQGPWRHGLDFEGRTPEGKAHRGEGHALRDYVCYGLPVVAAGAGTVVAAIDGVEDNRPGEVNTHANWGNAVVIAHGPWLHSVYAHLQPKSLRVKVGDVVAPGVEIGRCGNSGRSTVPHLHFQVQRGSTLGSATIPFELGDVIERGDELPTLSTHVIPREGSFVRPVQRDDGLVRALALHPGSELELCERTGPRKERAKVELDLMGTRWLRSARGRLAFDMYDNGLVVLDCQASADSLLPYLALAWARLPFDQSSTLCWRDTLSRRWLLPRWSRWVTDLFAAVVPGFGGLPVSFRLRRTEGVVEIESRAEGWNARSRLSLSGAGSGAGSGIEGGHQVTVEHRGATMVLDLHPIEATGDEKAA
jgi:murein DD-endopeptidase MepM/ murein hydrolase activator NlpD